MVKVKIIDVVNNTVLDELLFVHGDVVKQVVDDIENSIFKITNHNIKIEVEDYDKYCAVYTDSCKIAAKIFRRISSVNPYNKD